MASSGFLIAKEYSSISGSSVIKRFFLLLWVQITVQQLIYVLVYITMYTVQCNMYNVQCTEANVYIAINELK